MDLTEIGFVGESVSGSSPVVSFGITGSATIVCYFTLDIFGR